MNLDLNKAIEFLLARGNLPILYWLKKDILEVPVDREYKNLKKYAARIRILESQKPDGSWHNRLYNGPPEWKKTFYVIDTLRNAMELHKYGCNHKDGGVHKAMQYLFSTQSKQGYFWKGFLKEYMPTYQALTLEILCKFGWDKDKRTQKGFKWIMDYRQDDGGWTIPYRTLGKKVIRDRLHLNKKNNPLEPDRSKPFSHLVTGMVLRALAVSPTWRNSEEARKAGKLLIKRFFKPDKYEDRQLSSYWEDLTYPFWATDILSSLDSLSKIGLGLENEKIRTALEWLIGKQKEEGYWEAGSKKATLEDHLWVTLAVLRVMKRFELIEL